MRAELGADALREYLTLDRAAARAEAVPDALRAELRAASDVAAQKRAAAEVLWRDGCHAEALRLARDAFETLAAARDRLAPVDDEPPRDAEVGATDAERYEALLDAHAALEQALAPAGLDAPALRRFGRQRAVATLAALGAALALCVAWRAQPGSVHAEVSASFDLTFPASRVVDGNTETEWLLPDHATGFVDLKFSRPRRARTLELVNCMNLPFSDRGTRAFRVEVYADGRLVRAVDGTFPLQSSEPSRVTVDLASAGRIERIRVDVLGYESMGGGLAEAIVR